MRKSTSNSTAAPAEPFPSSRRPEPASTQPSPHCNNLPVEVAAPCAHEEASRAHCDGRHHHVLRPLEQVLDRGLEADYVGSAQPAVVAGYEAERAIRHPLMKPVFRKPGGTAEWFGSRKPPSQRSPKKGGLARVALLAAPAKRPSPSRRPATPYRRYPHRERTADCRGGFPRTRESRPCSGTHARTGRWDRPRGGTLRSKERESGPMPANLR